MWRLRPWTLVNMKWWLELYFERLGSSSQGDDDPILLMHIYIYKVLCAPTLLLFLPEEVILSWNRCWKHRVKKHQKRHVQCKKHGESMTFLREKHAPSFHVHNSKCENPMKIMRLELRGPPRFDRFSGLMRETWWNDPTIHNPINPINPINNSLNLKINPKTTK